MSSIVLSHKVDIVVVLFPLPILPVAAFVQTLYAHAVITPETSKSCNKQTHCSGETSRVDIILDNEKGDIGPIRTLKEHMVLSVRALDAARSSDGAGMVDVEISDRYENSKFAQVTRLFADMPGCRVVGCGAKARVLVKDEVT